MPAEEREPMPGASRRRLLALALGAPIVAAATAARTAATPRPHDASAWRTLLAEYERLSAAATAASGPADAAERELNRVRLVAKERANAEPTPPEIVLWTPERVLEADGQRIVIEAYGRPAQSRSELRARAQEKPEEKFRLDAWDEWQRRRAAHHETADVLYAERRFAVLDKRWTRATVREDAAVCALLCFPTVDPATIHFKFKLASRHHWEDPHQEVLQGCCAALGIELPTWRSTWEA